MDLPMKGAATRVCRSSDTSCGIPHVWRLGVSTLVRTVFLMSLAAMSYALNKASLKAPQRAYVELDADTCSANSRLGRNESERGLWRLIPSLWYAVQLNAE